MFKEFVEFVREIYETREMIPLHQPNLKGNEAKYVLRSIENNIVSTIGDDVGEFERRVASYVGSKHAIATVNGTAALHITLRLAGVTPDTEVITQALTFVGTSNAISYCGATPVYVDVDRDSLGMSPEALEIYLHDYCEVRDDGCCWNQETNRIIRACLPMHVFGFPVDLTQIIRLCKQFNILLLEDAAESLGSLYHEEYTGTFGTLSALSFNGNKVITTGGGGMVLTQDDGLAARARHITTTAKLKASLVAEHDELGFNYRLPNINAALGLGQLERLPEFIVAKRTLASHYLEWGRRHGVFFIEEPIDCRANYWLNTIVTKDRKERDQLLVATNQSGIMTRPAWRPMHRLPMYERAPKGVLSNTEWLCERIVNVPSSVPGDV